jgi:hypothetical protein
MDPIVTHGHTDTKPLKRHVVIVLIAAGALCAYLLAWTIGTQPTIGDEARHYRRAVNYFEAPLPHYRVACDPAYPATGPGAICYYDTSLWHELLALGWKAIGDVNLAFAQIYHLAFFLLLVVFTYLATGELYGERAGRWAAGLVAACPINLLLGMILYCEIPMLACMTIALYFLLKRKPIPLGAALGCAYLMKGPTAAPIILGLMMATLVHIGATWRQSVWRTFLVIVVTIVVMAPDMLWHVKIFGTPIMFRNYAACYYPAVISESLVNLPPPINNVILDLWNPEVAVRMLGPTGLLALVIGLVLGIGMLARALVAGLQNLRSKGIRAALASQTQSAHFPAYAVGLPMLCYVGAYMTLLTGAHDIRYLEPVTLFGSVAVGGLLGRWPVFSYKGRAKWLVRALGGLLVAALVGQMLAVPPVVHEKRRLDPELEAAFKWIQANTPPGARVEYIEENLTAITGRPIFWAALVPYLLFNTDEAEQMRLLKFLDIQYIAVHPTRRIDACTPGEIPTAYPRTWIRTLPDRPYLMQVYPPGPIEDTEGHFLLYQIDYSKVPAKWLAELYKPQPRQE